MVDLTNLDQLTDYVLSANADSAPEFQAGPDSEKSRKS